MVFGVAEALLFAGFLLLVYSGTAGLRRRLERWIARRLGTSRARRASVVVLGRRRGGTFGRGDDDDGR
jgi:hypothetical protein